MQGCGGSVIMGPSDQSPLLTGPRLTEAGIAGLALSRSLGHRAATFAGLCCDPTVHCQRLQAHSSSTVLVRKACKSLLYCCCCCYCSSHPNNGTIAEYLRHGLPYNGLPGCCSVSLCFLFPSGHAC